MTGKPSPESRSPLTAPPLRNPGQSLDDEIHRILDEEVVGYLFAAMWLLLLALTEWGRWWFRFPPQPVPFTLVAMAFSAYFARKPFVLRREVKRLRFARDGEKAVGQYLESLRANGYRVLHDPVGEGFNVDRALIGPAGLFAVETKTYHKPAKGKPEIVYDGERVIVAGHTPDRDPVAQSKAQARWLQNVLLESTGQRFEVQPVVLYPGWFVKTTAKPGAGAPWVLNPKALPAFLEHNPARLSDAEAQMATYHLSRFVRAAAK